MRVAEGATPAAAAWALPGWVRALRVPQWLHFLVLPAAGLDLSLPAHVSALALVRGVVLAFLLLAIGYLVNAIGDRFVDRHVEKNPLAGQAGGDLRSHAGLLGALVGATLVLAFTAPWPAGAAALVCLASGLLYSVGPRLKRFPVVGTAMNATHFGPLLWLALATATTPAGLGALTGVFCCFILQSQLVHELEDEAEDAAGAVRTTVVAFGRRWAALVAAALGLAAGLATAFALGLPLVGAAIALLSGVGLPAVLWRGDEPARVRQLHRLAVLGAGVVLFVLVRFVER